MKYSAKETILDIIFNPVTFLLVCVGLFVSAMVISNHYTYESTKKKKCERSAEWIVCPEIRFLASDVNRVSIIKKTDFDAQNLTIEIKEIRGESFVAPIFKPRKWKTAAREAKSLSQRWSIS